MTNCTECKQDCKGFAITGKMEETSEQATLCPSCFSKYELVRPATENIFKKKEEEA